MRPIKLTPMGVVHSALQITRSATARSRAVAGTLRVPSAAPRADRFLNAFNCSSRDKSGHGTRSVPATLCRAQLLPLFGDQLQEPLLRIGEFLEPLFHQNLLHLGEIDLAIDLGEHFGGWH